MALTAGSVFNITSTATTGNVNGAGFNPGNANFLTDLTTDANTANTASPVVSSATYTFVAGDVGAALYIKSGTSWTPGFYSIASVAGGKATLNAAIGSAWQLNAATGYYSLSTVVGCATIGTPTSGTYGVNYAMQDTAIINAVADFAAIGASTTLTSATANFTPVMVGNFFHQTTTGTGAFGVVGWYEIVSYTNATTVVLDRTENSGTASVACTGYVGGAGRFNGLEDTFQAMFPASAVGTFTHAWFKSGGYTLSQAISSSGGANVQWIGYTSIPGDTCNGANRPLFTAAANSVVFGVSPIVSNLSWTSTSSLGIQNISRSFNCKYLNTSPTAGRFAVSIHNGTIELINCEVISQNGQAISSDLVGNAYLFGCYIHDSSVGVNCIGTNSVNSFIGNLFEGNSTTDITVPTGYVGSIVFADNTFYGREAKMGTALNLTKASANNNRVINNIFYGKATGISVNTGISNSNYGQNNDFFNNTTDDTNWNKDITDIALDPQFVGASQVTGTTGQGLAGSNFQDTTQNFTTAGVVANRDFLHISSGGSLTAACYLITAISTTTNPNDTLTLNNNPGTGAATGVYWLGAGHNFAIGTNLKGLGFPGFANTTGGQTTGYMDIGAIQRQEAGSGGGTPILQSGIIQGLGAI